jgi:GNAT superfamily N-acetyltransferase
MPTYTVRRATLADLGVLVEHRVRMFDDMGVLAMPGADRDRLTVDFRTWVADALRDGTYLAWLVDAQDRDGAPRAVAGAGATIIPWPPGPFYSTGRLAFVYNVYTEPDHRRRGLGRMLMEAVHAYCRTEGIGSVALNASTFGQPLYASMGYRVASSPMMFLSLE